VIDAVLFDLDGTLADTAPDMARTVNLMRTNRGLQAVPPAVVRPHVSQGARGMIMSAFGIGTDHPDFVAMRTEFLDLYAGNLCIDTQLFPGMDELLARLDREAIAWGVVGGDTCARAKPFPDPLLFAASSMGVAPAATLYVGDDERDVQAARAAGMPVVVAGYGYLGGTAPATWQADAILESPAHLDAWIRDASGHTARASQ